jgi:hypothetical protein
MPTVLRKNGFDFKINTEDHEPMHVHVWYQGRQVLINFEAEVSIRRNYGLNRNELRQALIIVEEHQSFLQTKWREIYGQ